jgi:hypothetical protein
MALLPSDTHPLPRDRPSLKSMDLPLKHSAFWTRIACYRQYYSHSFAARGAPDELSELKCIRGLDDVHLTWTGEKSHVESCSLGMQPGDCGRNFAPYCHPIVEELTCNHGGAGMSGWRRRRGGGGGGPTPCPPGAHLAPPGPQPHAPKTPRRRPPAAKRCHGG